MGMGRVWVGNSNLGETHFWGKSILTFGASKHPKCMPIWPYIHVLHFSSRGKLGSYFYLHDFACGMFLLHDLGSWAFSSSSFTHVGAPSSSWEFVECEIHDFGFALYIFPSRGQSFFIFWRLRISFL